MPGGDEKMNIAKISTKGQVTLPIDVRRKLDLKEGDHLLISEENGRYYIDNADHVQGFVSNKASAHTAEAVDTKLDEADRQAARTLTASAGVKLSQSADKVPDRAAGAKSEIDFPSFML